MKTPTTKDICALSKAVAIIESFDDELYDYLLDVDCQPSTCSGTLRDIITALVYSIEVEEINKSAK